MSDSTFIYRVAIGLSVFAVFLAVDTWRRPKELRRLKEYAFLFGITALAMAYGVAHDYVTWSISHDYFVIFKGIASASHRYGGEMIKLAMAATWSVGLITGAILLVANNPDSQGRRLPYRRLILIALFPLAASIATEAVLGLAFHHYDPAIADTHPSIMRLTLGRKGVFTVWSMHIGAYAGGVIGLVIAVWRVLRLKGRGPLAMRSAEQG